MKNTIILLSALFSVCAQANGSQDVSGFYLGGGVGNNTFSDDNPFTKVDDNGTSFKIIGGYQFNRIVAVEAQYTNYGDFKIVDTAYDLGASNVSVAANIGYSFNNGLRPFAIFGLGYMSVDIPTTDNEDDLSLRIGAGLEYTPIQLENITFRAAYEMDHFTVKPKGSSLDTDVQIGSFYAGATYKF
ncbi:porin family protein [Vibrio owensii]|uniref:porin family protein n=1 Tax=Vibrio owensii TaxID=696485 RepID=UPI0038CEAE97